MSGWQLGVRESGLGHSGRSCLGMAAGQAGGGQGGRKRRPVWLGHDNGIREGSWSMTGVVSSAQLGGFEASGYERDDFCKSRRAVRRRRLCTSCLRWVEGSEARVLKALATGVRTSVREIGDECFLVVGDNNDIREFTTIHRSSKSSDTTVIGDGNLIMGSCHIAHDCKVGNNNIFANNTLFAGHVVIEDCCHTAGAIVVHQFCHIGSYSFIGGGSVISQDVPKYMIVSGDRAEIRGLNLEGLRRNGFSSEEVQTIRKAYRKIFMSSDTTTGCFEDRLSEVEQNRELFDVSVVCSMVKSIRDSFKGTRRGICKFRHLFGSSTDYGFS
ncbi:hypothetical protein IEQ34_003042 [Dendrobium chrysotoxum]|uniref:UDP N-acetylglucosamine O-acyltransferase C-terminal domain-containing protein n=1 Tax=Dendrobium chrysotoxum TaxID=161865 RepID=A0AAV7HIM5_DENCH|nr:hypothetical protein IEQ34_003042 [Dendrobium chrysotoxum]